jgi:uncharacterized protein DUF5615
MTALYANENLPLPVVEALRQLGHDVLTTAEGGKAGQAIPDEAMLAFATAERRVLVTLNRKHFIRLHALQPDHAGIVVCTFDLDYTALAQRVHSAILAEPEMTGRLIRINRPG